MLGADRLNPPIQYELIWLIIGSVLLLAIPVWYGVVYWLTRRKPAKSLNDLKHLPTGAELERLKAKYLKLIEKLYQSYLAKEISRRQLHKELSMTVRNFVAEAQLFPAPYLTLSDLKLTPYPTLSALIEDYYPKEFASIESGDGETSVNAAKGCVSQWPF